MKIYGTIQKVEEAEDGTIIVEGIASSEDRDMEGEVILGDAMRGAIEDYMKFGNIREMHQPKAAGVAMDMYVDADNMTRLTAKIVDTEAVKKVKTGVYKGFSIGGRVTKRGDKDPNVIEGIRLIEVSLVDRPCNPSAVLEMWKGDNIESEEKDMSKKKPEDVTKADPAPATQKPAAEPAPATQETVEIKKGLDAVSSLASLLQNLFWLQQYVDREATEEGDGSKVPAGLKDAITSLGSILVQMTQEEVKELFGEQEGGDMDDVAYAAFVGDLKKVAPVAVDTTKSDEPKEDFTKMIGDLSEQLKKIADENGDLKKQVEALKAEPAAAKGALLSVSKAQDIGGSAENDELVKAAETLAAIKDPNDRAKFLIKMTHAHGGRQVA